MEWAIGIPILLLVLVCPLMMVGMIVGGWVMGRRATGGHEGHGGHGMMMCHGGHGGGDTRHETGDTATPAGIVEELKAERGRLDELIARAESGEAG
ncbi:MAG: hypothetical protein Q7R32_08205 [Dehalococcoidia bacterium]|nr:hypothetical protein [Dehalococcoidia bacterium]